MHVAIIMDGNGRWARARGRPRAAGHVAGVETVRKITEHASTLGVGTLTLYAFSADNWRRPAPEVRALMRLFRRALRSEMERCLANGVR
ncbi:MAG TPA: polyprenyl diphosphate synthase, partial [Trinickia sp.]|nr:polyprenyl diphosphate synthase [Trinickia sp.]